MGSGKTVFVQNLITEMIKSGYLGCNVFDVKSDYYHARKPLQEEFRKFLPRWREPKALPVKNFVPKYIADLVYKKKNQQFTNIPNGMNIGQIQISDLNSDDLISSIFNVKSTEPQAAFIRNIWRIAPGSLNELVEKLSNPNLNLSEFLPKEMNIKFGALTMQSVKSRLSDIISEGLVGDQYPMNFPEEMAQGNIPCLSFEGHGDIKQGYTQATVASICRQIYAESANKSGILYGKRKFVVIDDAGKIVPPSPHNPSSKSPIIYNFSKVGRQFNIFTIVIAQNVSDIDKELIKSARYIIGLRQMTPSDLDTLFKEKGIDPDTFEDLYSNYPVMKPNRIDYGEYSGAREAIVWDADDLSNPTRGWIPLPGCGINQAI